MGRWKVLAVVLAGAVGIVGAFGGYNVRHSLVAKGLPDYVVALTEDAVAIVGGLLIVSRVA